MLYKWTTDECLKMPVRRAFAMLRAGRKIEFRRSMELLVNLSDISATPLYTGAYHKELRAMFMRRMDPENNKKYSPPVLNAEDPKSGQMIKGLFS